MRKKDIVEKIIDGVVMIGVVGMVFGLGMKFQAKRGAK